MKTWLITGLIIAAVLVVPAVSRAHEGHAHKVMGTISSVDGKNLMRVVEARIDCDQDAIWLRCEPAGPACHTGEPSCFYRRIDAATGMLERIVFSPDQGQCD